MKNKTYLCPTCNAECKYRGSRRFYCKSCLTVYDLPKFVGVGPRVSDQGKMLSDLYR